MDNRQMHRHKGDILIVDDYLSSLNSLLAMLTAEGYEARGVPDGPMALTAVKNRPPELIFLDIRMPGMDGFEVCQKIKSEETLSDIPILFLSAMDELGEKIKGFTFGAVDFISKPFQIEEVKARVDTHLTLSRLKRSLDQQVKDRTAELKKSEETLAKQLNFERLISEIAANMARTQHADLKDEIDKTLQLIGRELQTERAFFGQFSSGGKRLVFKNIWAAEGISKKSKIFEMNLASEFSWLAETIRSGRIINVGPGLNGFPDEASELRRQLAHDEISSGCVLPVTVQGRCIGFLGVDTISQPREYPTPLVDRLKLVADIIGLAVLRIRSQQLLNEQFRFEKLISDLSSKFVDLPADKIDQEINSGLFQIAEAIDLDRSNLFQYSDDRAYLIATHTYSSPMTKPMPPSIIIEEQPWWTEKLRRGEIVNISRFEEIPADALGERHWWQEHGIKSAAVIPLFAGGVQVGAISFATMRAEREWSNELMQRFRLIGEVFTNALIRQRNQLDIARRLAFEKLLFDLSASFANVDDDTDRNIDDAMKRIGIFIGADRCGLVQRIGRTTGFRGTHLWIAPELPTDPVLPTPDRSDARFDKLFPWLTEKMLKGETIALTQFDDLPPEAGNFKEYTLKVKLLSLLLLPLSIDDQVVAFMGIDAFRSQIDWTEETVQRLNMMGEVIANALVRTRSKEELKSAFKKVEDLKDRLQQENIYLREEVYLRHQHEEIIGKSEPVIEMLSRAEQVAETDATVLIQGETGTGKELLANAIHRLSRRKDRTMIKVNCAALPATLIESELFGREKGAYTGAMSRQIGRFETADGSTLFLDEIGEMPLELQAKLLRVLQEGQFERLGSPKTINVDVRIIASTNRDLAKAVREGTFREDLYYRLNVFSITVPPLRDRTEDIPLLVWAFVKELESSMGKTIHKIPKNSLDTLKQYDWPGNVRELKNQVENAMIVTKGKTLQIRPPVDPSSTVQKSLKLEDVERGHIKDVLNKTSWRVSGKNGAADLLGLKPTTLESRMKKLGIMRPK